MVFFTPATLLMTQLAAPVSPGVLIMERALETFVGALVGILVVATVRQRSSRPYLLWAARRPGR